MAWNLLKSKCNGLVRKAWSLSTLSERLSVSTNLKGWGFAFHSVFPHEMVLNTLFNNTCSETLSKRYCQMSAMRKHLWPIDSKCVHFSITFIFIMIYT